MSKLRFARNVISNPFCIFLGLLWTGPFNIWMNDLTDGNIRPSSWLDCKLYMFLYHFFAHYSSAILIIMSIEKFIALYFPFKAKILCTLRNAKLSAILTALIFIIFDAQFFYLFEFIDGACRYVDKSYGFVIERIKSVIYTFGPFIVMAVTSLAISVKFFMLKRRSQNGTQSTSQAVNKSATRGTAILLILSLAFFVLTGPASIYKAASGVYGTLIWNIVICLQFSNHSINAVLYCIVGSRFRAELVNLTRCEMRRNDIKDTSGSLSHIPALNNSIMVKGNVTKY